MISILYAENEIKLNKNTRIIQFSSEYKIPFPPKLLNKPLSNDKYYFGISLNAKLYDTKEEIYFDKTNRYKYIKYEDTSDFNIDIPSQKHSPLIGWAADGFPIYALYGYAYSRDKNSKIIEMISGYRIRFGSRAKGKESPQGYYDGSYESDYIYDRTRGNLDACNGRYTITPEYPNGTYAYFLTDNWPVLPQCFRAKPSTDFLK